MLTWTDDVIVHMLDHCIVSFAQYDLQIPSC